MFIVLPASERLGTRSSDCLLLEDGRVLAVATVIVNPHGTEFSFLQEWLG